MRLISSSCFQRMQRKQKCFHSPPPSSRLSSSCRYWQRNYISTGELKFRSEKKSIIAKTYSPFIYSSSSFSSFPSIVSFSYDSCKFYSTKIKNEEIIPMDASQDVEASFQRKSPIDHILLRPGMYVGATDCNPSYQYVYEQETKAMVLKTINISPALLKIFDEILVNAADNKVRDRSMNEIRVTIFPGSEGQKSINNNSKINNNNSNNNNNDKEKVKEKDIDNNNKGYGNEGGLPLISVFNNGKGVPIQFHSSEKLYIPELVFGHLLTGSNFDDEKALTTGGRHGYGAKLTNILSKSFRIETVDSIQKLYYSQEWKDNMKQSSSPFIEASSSRSKDDYTRIEFSPDLKRFNSENENIIDQDTLQALHTRVIDIAGCVPGVKVYLNDELIPISSFRDYCGLYLPQLPQTPDNHQQPPPTTEIQDSFSSSLVSGSEEASSLLSSSSSTYYKLAFQQMNDRWTVGVAVSPNNTFNHVSFVNSINTHRGGTHVNYITSQIVSSLSTFLKRKYPSLEEYITAPLIRSNLFIFVKAEIENPSFDSQAKELLTTKPSSFGSTCPIPDSFLKLLEKDSDLVKTIVASVRSKEQATSLASIVQATSPKSRSKVLMDIPKLEDAIDAGGPTSKSCTLILTEGDSAKALAVAGLEVVGRKKYGVLPLSGKVLNVRDINIKQISTNKEFQQLCRVLGLDIRKPNGWMDEMRYGKLMIMTDQDHDGSHIKGLLINMLEYFWPELLERNDFLEAFITPIIKAFHKRQVLSFYSMSEYYNWCDTINSHYHNQHNDNNTNNNDNNAVGPLTIKSNTESNSQAEVLGSSTISTGSMNPSSDQLRKWRIKYYKGLGTSTSLEGREYFKNLELHRKRFKWETEDDGKIIDLVFNRKRTDDRKEWMQKYATTSSDFEEETEEEKEGETCRQERSAGVRVDVNISDNNKDKDDDEDNQEEEKISQRTDISVDLSILTISDFINKELVHFSHADLIRSIPSVIDGLKPSQRKVLYGCFKRRDGKNTEIKVAQLAGYVAEHSAYHHGEQSLHGTIINMAQDFVGSNNLPLLKPLGQFGTRLNGGKDAASPRYLFTKLQDYTRKLFPPDDDPLLKSRIDDGQIIEPVYYVPIIPLLLINGATGVGTGWSTYIPPHNPRDVIYAVRDQLLLLQQQQEQRRKQVPLSGVEGTKRTKSEVEEDKRPIKPWIRGFEGFISPNPNAKKPNTFITFGRWERLSSTKLRIMELPYGRWILDYKQILLKLMEEGEIRDFEELHTTNKVEFIITMPQQKLKECFLSPPPKSAQSAVRRKEKKKKNNKIDKSNYFQESGGLSLGHKINTLFALETSIHLTNMHAFDAQGKIKKYNNPHEIIADFIPIRYKLYTERKAMLLSLKEQRQLFLKNKVRFLNDVAHGSLTSLFRENLKREELIKNLIHLNYDPNPKKLLSTEKLEDEEREEKEKEEEEGEETTNEEQKVRKRFDPRAFDYLTSMPLHSFTEEERNKLQSELETLCSDITTLENKSEIDMWLEDLKVLEGHIK